MLIRCILILSACILKANTQWMEHTHKWYIWAYTWVCVPKDHGSQMYTTLSCCFTTIKPYLSNYLCIHWQPENVATSASQQVKIHVSYLQCCQIGLQKSLNLSYICSSDCCYPVREYICFSSWACIWCLCFHICLQICIYLLLILNCKIGN